MIEFVEGDILNAKEKYICHQCNCFSKGSAGLAKSLFDRYPYANIYATRREPSKSGTIHIAGDGHRERYVINMFAQRYPSLPSDYDTLESRQKDFNSCLLAILAVPNIEGIAFPHGIGCGLAGGNWMQYKSAIEGFAERLEREQRNARVVIYRKS